MVVIINGYPETSNRSYHETNTGLNYWLYITTLKQEMAYGVCYPQTITTQVWGGGEGGIILKQTVVLNTGYRSLSWKKQWFQILDIVH